jgi:aspartate-semialdehyde dehydrogenase
LEWQGESLLVEDVATADFSGIDIALTSAGATASREVAPRLAAAGALVVDNSSAWRMDPEVPLAVADVNPHALDSIPKGIIANPNCTTMAAMPVLRPLHNAAGLSSSLTVATYQAVSGAGRDGVEELATQVEESLNGNVRVLTFDGAALPAAHRVFPAPIAFNVVPEAGAYVGDDSGETVEEKKFRDESRKILEYRRSACVVHVRSRPGVYRPLVGRYRQFRSSSDQPRGGHGSSRECPRRRG